MARYEFKLPSIGEGTAEAEIVDWRVAVGDRIEEDQPLVDMMTEKATIEISSPVAGRVLELHGHKGEMQAVGAVLAVLEVAGAGNVDETAPGVQPEDIAPLGEKPLAPPAVRQRARDLGISLQVVPGTGPAGRITHADLDRYLVANRQAAAPAVSALVEKHGEELVEVVGLRRKIAERLQDIQRRVPHFSYIEEVDVTALEELRATLNETASTGRPRLTLLPFLMRAMVKALVHHPRLNARFDDEAGLLHRFEAVHIGIATQTPSGLVVPVVRHAEARDLWNAAREIARLATAARASAATREELSGSTITITSLGALGGLASTPVINAPEVAIVGVNRIIERPVVRGGQIAIRKMMNLSSSFDHRIVDGWDAAQFIQKIRGLLEQPAMLFIDS
jgi:2-oxoisovalerate dehydrogenase E2 component (dihydrolipoyl transacylase)